MKTVVYIAVRVEIEHDRSVSVDELIEDINYEFGFLDPNGPKVIATEISDYGDFPMIPIS